MYHIFTKLLHELECQKAVVLVTVISGRGSVPSTVGCKMLVGHSGRLTGTIGGGSLERSAERLALQSLRQEKSQLHNYSLSKEHDADDLNMICGGDIVVLFQYVSPKDQSWFSACQAIVQRLEENEGGLLLQPLDGSAPSLYNGYVHVAGRPRSELTGQIFAEPITVGPRVIIFGAGHIARQLAPILRLLHFRPVVFDKRPDYTQPDRFPESEQVICGDFEHISDYLTVTAEDYIVVVTSGHADDFTVQRQIMQGEYAYLGVIGSRTKTKAINQRLVETGIPQKKLEDVHTPIGIPIRAASPEEISVSIAAELILVRATLNHY